MKGLALAIITALTAGLLLMAGTAEARATRIPFTESESCMVTSPGEWTYPDGNHHSGGLTEVCDHSASIPQLVGTDYIVFNANLDATGSGPVWLTWRLETEGGGWEGVAVGKVTGLLTSPSGSVRAVGHGTGAYEGQLYFGHGEVAPDGTASAGFILVP
jgi:hypothetical protein